jgi:hypothetical protein
MGTSNRAPKGGVKIMGVFYKGGQFLPSEQPQRGKYNRKSNKCNPTKLRKQEIAPYQWESPPTKHHRSIYAQLAGVFAKMQDGELVFCASEQTLSYYKKGKTEVYTMIGEYNAGARWQDTSPNHCRYCNGTGYSFRTVSMCINSDDAGWKICHVCGD